MVYKSSVGDFPLKVHPCKYWWVRYAVACVRTSELYDRQKWKTLKEMGLTSGYSRSGSKKDPTIRIYRDGTDEELERGSELYKIIHDTIRDQPKWEDCPFENESQSDCAFYEVSPFYEKIPLEELRQRSGYDI